MEGKKFFPLKLVSDAFQGARIFASSASYMSDKDFCLIANNMKRNDYLLLHDWSPRYNSRNSINHERRFLENCKYPQNVHFLSNETYSHSERLESGMKSYLINHNCWINENMIRPYPAERIYSGVITARAKKWKRYHLAKKCQGLAIICQRWNISHHYGEDDDSYKELDYLYLNERMLDAVEVRNIYNQSQYGLSLSVREGACYSSSEMLLCGLPVISTEPDDEGYNTTGGREVWYDSNNSITTKATSDDVHSASIKVLDKLKSGDFNRDYIRETHIERSRLMRKHFEERVLGESIGLSVEEIKVFMEREFLFDTTYRGKKGRCRLLPEGFNVQVSEIMQILRS